MSEQAYLEAPYAAQDRRDEAYEQAAAEGDKQAWATLANGIDDAVELLNDHGKGVFGFCAAENLAGDIAQFAATVRKEKGLTDEAMAALGSYVMTLVGYVVEKAGEAYAEEQQ